MTREFFEEKIKNEMLKAFGEQLNLTVNISMFFFKFTFLASISVSFFYRILKTNIKYFKLFWAAVCSTNKYFIKYNNKRILEKIKSYY